jgi:hypothetical protein
MSAVDPALTDRFARTAIDYLPALDPSLATLASVLLVPVQVVAFWLGVLLAFAHLPLLATGVAAEHPVGFLALLCLNVAALVVGHSHNREERDGTSRG